MVPVLDVQGLTRRFGAATANDHIDLTVNPGQVVGLLGHNGAGKTTLVSQVVGLLRPDAGHVQVMDCDAVAHPGRARRLVSLQPQSQAPIDGLTPRQAISIAAALRGADRRRERLAVSMLAEELDIGAWLDRRALPEGRGLSGGVRRLTAFAMAVAVPPPLIVLDEPTNDIDPARRRRLWDALRRRADQGSGVLVVTHNVVEAERVLDQVVVLDRGRVMASGTPAAVRGHHDDALRLELNLLPDTLVDHPAFSEAAFAVEGRSAAGQMLWLTVSANAAGDAVAWAGRLREAQLIESFALVPVSLEDAYLRLTDRQLAPSTDGNAR